MKQFLKLFIIVLIIDIAIGFSMSHIVGTDEPSFLFKVIDEIISFPTSLWNRLLPEKGIYAATTSAFWFVIIFNALIQTLVIFGMIKLFKKRKSR